MHTKTVLLTALVVVAAVASVGVAPAVADEDGFSNPFGDDDEDESTVGFLTENIGSFVDGVKNYVAYKIGGPENDLTPDESLTQAAATVNGNSTETVAWANSCFSAPSSDHTTKVTLEADDGGDSAIRYVEVDANGTDYQDIRVTKNTDRQVDDTVRLEGQWVDTLPSETETFMAEYVNADGDPCVTRTDPFVRRMAGQYGSSTTTSFEVSLS